MLAGSWNEICKHIFAPFENNCNIMKKKKVIWGNLKFIDELPFKQHIQITKSIEGAFT